MVAKVMVEVPKGSRNKYEYDKVNKCIRYDRMLHSPVHYPTDYGFFLDTLARDGDPLDALVLVWEPTFPGCIIDARPVGVFKMTDEKGIDEKILCIPVHDPLWMHLNSLYDVPPHLLREIEHFFDIYKELEEKRTVVEGWANREEAIAIIKESQQRFRDARAPAAPPAAKSAAKPSGKPKPKTGAASPAPKRRTN